MDGEHDCELVASPEHCWPPQAGAGSVQVLLLVCVPVDVLPAVLHVTEQAPYDPQAAQLPSTTI